jgi:hypothetical protein
MNIKNIDTLILEHFFTPLHAELGLSQKKEDYTEEFIDFFDKKLKDKTIRFLHLIDSPIDTNRWLITDDLDLIMYSIPVFSKGLLSIRSCIETNLCSYLAKKEYNRIDKFFDNVCKIFGHNKEDLCMAQYGYNVDNNIEKNIRQLATNIFGYNHEQQGW